MRDMQTASDDEMILVPKREILEIIALLASAQRDAAVREKGKVAVTHRLGARRQA